MSSDLLRDPWAVGPWCWCVDEVRLLPAPIPCRGMQGLWPVSLAHIVDALDALAGVRQTWSALTLLQPFASAISHGPKRVENRPWRRRVPPGGMWIGLHAGVGLYDRAQLLVTAWRDPRPVPDPPFGLWPGAPALEDMPRGAMLGAMHVASIVRYPSLPLEAP